MAQIEKSSSGGTRLEISNSINRINQEIIDFTGVAQIEKSSLPEEWLRLGNRALEAPRLEINKLMREVIRR